MVFLILVVVVLGILAALRYPTFKRRRLARQDPQRPPGTAHLDDVDAVRPEIAASTLASARSAVSSDVPDGVLADALLDATPEQLQHIFASVSQDVMAAAMGRDEVQQRPMRAEDRAQLQGAGDSVDDLEIWNFGDKT